VLRWDSSQFRGASALYSRRKTAGGLHKGGGTERYSIVKTKKKKGKERSRTQRRNRGSMVTGEIKKGGEEGPSDHLNRDDTFREFIDFLFRPGKSFQRDSRRGFSR